MRGWSFYREGEGRGGEVVEKAGAANAAEKALAGHLLNMGGRRPA
jgi:hypothetical protein